jgi:hypothetical protein
VKHKNYDGSPIKISVVKALKVDYGYEVRTYRTAANAADLYADLIVEYHYKKFDWANATAREEKRFEKRMDNLFKRAKRRILPIMKKLLA